MLLTSKDLKFADDHIPLESSPTRAAAPHSHLLYTGKTSLIALQFHLACAEIHFGSNSDIPFKAKGITSGSILCCKTLLVLLSKELYGHLIPAMYGDKSLSRLLLQSCLRDLGIGAMNSG